MIANDADSPPFVSFIPTSGPSAYTVVQKVDFPAATNGIEQCAYDPTTDAIYLNIPEVNGPGNDTQPGAIVIIDPTSLSVVSTFAVNINFCAGPQGMALGSRTAPLVPGSGGDGQILLGCNAPSVGGPVAGQMNTISINDTTGGVVNIYENLGGNDEVYHTETPAIIPNGDWFLAGGSFTPVEQVVAVSPFVASGIESPSPAIITLIPTGFPGGTTRRTHSVASWAGIPPGLGSLLIEAAIFPVPATGGGSPGFPSTLCTSAAAQGCIAFFLQSPITE
jgi:hypothetical protein